MIPHTPDTAQPMRQERKQGKAAPLYCFIITGSPAKHALGDLTGMTCRYFGAEAAKCGRVYMLREGFTCGPIYKDKTGGDL